MDAPGNDSHQRRAEEARGTSVDPDDGSAKELAEKLLLAGVGAVALTGERIEALADALAERGGMRRDEAKQTLDQLSSRWRGDAVRASERASTTLSGFFRELGLVTRDDWEELDLRVAQLEHRLRLLEDGTAPAPQPQQAPPPPPPPPSST
jgi:polyhydroxyalkanoate synthesis regulator phasin